jgi:hypothetical protein
MVYNIGAGFTTPPPNATYPGPGLQEQSSTLFLSGTIPNDLTVLDSASISQDILYSGSINLVAGSGIAFDGKTITSTVTSQVLAAGPGIQISNSTIVNIGTLIPGSNVLINSGSIGVPLYAGPGLDFSSGTYTNTGTLAPGTGIGISGGVVSNLSPLSGLVAGSGLSLSGTTVANSGVLSFNGRSGTVLPAAGDYTTRSVFSDVETTAGIFSNFVKGEANPVWFSVSSGQAGMINMLVIVTDQLSSASGTWSAVGPGVSMSNSLMVNNPSYSSYIWNLVLANDSNSSASISYSPKGDAVALLILGVSA